MEIALFMGPVRQWLYTSVILNWITTNLSTIAPGKGLKYQASRYARDRYIYSRVHVGMLQDRLLSDSAA